MRSAWYLLAATTFLAACGGYRITSAPEPAGGNPGPAAPPAGPGPSFTLPQPPPNTGAPPAPPPAGTCGEETHTLERLPPEIVVILDRSNTMRFPVGGSPNSRLFDVGTAVEDVVEQTQSKVYWGLRFFPTVQGCEVSDQMEVALALDNHPLIAAAMHAATPNSLNTGTPMQLAIRKAAAQFAARSTLNPKYIVLGTDGLPNCKDGNAGADDTPGTIQALVDARAAGVHTFVVGIAAGDEQSPSARGLSALAEAGGEPRTVEPRFYAVKDRSELAQILGDITVRAGSCVFPLTKKPPSPDSIKVRVDGKDVPRDPVNGWSFDANTTAVVLNGTFCAGLQQSRIDVHVQVLFGCQVD